MTLLLFRYAFMRFLLVTVGSGGFIVYTLRVNISVVAIRMKEVYGWNEAQKGLILVGICLCIPLNAS